MADLLVAAVGDSVMWGQGLEIQDKFVTLAAANIAKQLNKTPKVRSPSAHSGAKILAPEPVPGEPTARESFVDAHPRLFQDPERKKQFLDGTNEEMVVLFGEVPAGFPTIDFQVDWIRRTFPQEANRTDLLLIDGGANDLDFQEVLDPENDNL